MMSVVPTDDMPPGKVSLEHPLPEDIQSMDRDDTVCKFCGVSYFIHHEIKKLETEIESLKNEINRLQNVETEKRHLETQLTTAEQKLTSECNEKKNLELQVSKLQSEILTCNSELSECKEQISKKDTFISELNNFKTSAVAMRQALPFFKRTLLQLRADHKLMESSHHKFSSEVQSEIADCRKHFGNLSALYEQERSDLCSKLTGREKEANELKAELTQSQYNLTKSVSECEELRGFQKAYNQLKSMYENGQSSHTALENTIAEQKQELQKKSLEATQFQQIIQTKESEIVNLKRQIETHSESLSKSIQWYKEEMVKKTQSISDLEQRVNDLNGQIRQTDLKSKERQQQMELSLTEYEKIKDAFVLAKSENEDLRQERETLIASHQHRLEELQLAFREKLNEGGYGYEQKLNEALQHERSKFEREKESVEQLLKQSHQIEMEIEKQKFDELLSNQSKAVEQARSEMMGYAQEEAKRLHATIASLKREVEVTQSGCEQQLQSKQTELDLITHRLRSMEEAFNEKLLRDQQSSNVSSDQLNDLKSQNEILMNDKTNLENQLQSAIDEVKSLQETVQRECEERFELTEALAEAREALLKNHLNVNPASIRHSPSLNGKRLPELEQQQAVIFPDHANNPSSNRGPDKESDGGLPPKPVKLSGASYNYTEPTPPGSRNSSLAGVNSVRRTASNTTVASVRSNSSGKSTSQSSQPQDRTMALYRAAKSYNKTVTNGPSPPAAQKSAITGANKNEFKSLLNLAMRRGSSN